MKRIKLNCSRGVFLDLKANKSEDWGQGIDFIKSLSGVKHVEIWVELLPLTKEQIKYLNRKLKLYRRIIHAPWLGIDFLSPNKPIQKAALTVLDQISDLAGELKAEVITWHLGRVFDFYNNLENKVEVPIKLMNLCCSKRGPIHTIENMSKSDFFIKSAYDFNEMTEVIEGFENYNLTLDCGHILKDDGNLVNILGKYINQVHNIHFHDTTAEKRDHVGLGDGLMDVEGVLRVLARKKYDRFLTLEVVGKEKTRESWEKLQSLIV